ncbi:hypothetical protein ES703_87891 [subsurface metagenome]
MFGRTEQLYRSADFYYLAQIHNGDAIANTLGNTEVVGDIQVGQPLLPLKLL